MMSDDEFDDNVEGNIGVMGDGTKTEAQSNIGEKRKHEEEENSSEEDSEGFDSDASDYELDNQVNLSVKREKKLKQTLFSMLLIFPEKINPCKIFWSF